MGYNDKRYLSSPDDKHGKNNVNLLMTKDTRWLSKKQEYKNPINNNITMEKTEMKKLIWLICLILITGCSLSQNEITQEESVSIETEIVVQPTPTMSSEWDLVFFSNSSGFDVAEKYAAHIENDLGVTVNVIDKATGRLSIGRVLTWLANNEKLKETSDTPNLIDDIAEAEVIVIYAIRGDSESESNPGDWWCETYPYHVNNCDLETFDKYIEDLSAFYAKVFELRAGQPTIIRAFNSYVPLYASWSENNIYDECLQCFLNYNEAIKLAAEKYNVPIAPVFEKFNGIGFDEDPKDKGYIGPDGFHTTTDGSQAIADALQSLGYEVTQFPGE